jgi:hypothetical protein
VTHAIVRAANLPHVQQARAAGGVIVGRLTARRVESRTLDELGPPEEFVVFAFRR